MSLTPELDPIVAHLAANGITAEIEDMSGGYYVVQVHLNKETGESIGITRTEAERALDVTSVDGWLVCYYESTEAWYDGRVNVLSQDATGDETVELIQQRQRMSTFIDKLMP